jgi:hypothetical protein
MSKKVTIGSSEYNLPSQGESPKWGEELSDIVNALIDVANSVQGPNDILESSANIANTGTFPALITGLYFDPTSVRSFEVDYNLSRKITKAIASTSGDGLEVTVNTTGDHYLRVGDSVAISGVVSGLSGNRIVTSIPTAASFTYAGTYVGNNSTETFQVELLESGVMYGNNSLHGWKFARTSIGDAKVDLDINTSGNIIYNPEILVGSLYSGSIRFIGKAISKS